MKEVEGERGNFVKIRLPSNIEILYSVRSHNIEPLNSVSCICRGFTRISCAEWKWKGDLDWLHK